MGRKVTRLAGVNNYAPGMYTYWYRYDDTGETFWHIYPDLDIMFEEPIEFETIPDRFTSLTAKVIINSFFHQNGM